MAEIAPPRIESIADPNSGRMDESAPKSRAKAAGTGKRSTLRPPEVSAPEEEDKHTLDEMA